MHALLYDDPLRGRQADDAIVASVGDGGEGGVAAEEAGGVNSACRAETS